MHHLKKLGFVCLMITAAVAVAGASSAAAEQSVFCKVNETPCSAGNRYANGTEFVLKSKGPLKWVGYFEGIQVRKVECQSAEFKGKIVNAGGSTETAEVAFTTQLLSNCGGCSITTLQSAKMKFNWISGTMNGSLTTNGFEYGFTCSSTYCVYGSEIKGSTLIGGNPASVAFAEAAIPVVSGSGLACGKTAKFSGEFEVSTPKPLYVSNG